MASSWITTRTTKDGSRRYRVLYRVGGAESKHSDPAPVQARTLKDAAEAWRLSRVDVAAGTMITYVTAINRLIPRIGSTPSPRSTSLWSRNSSSS